MEPGTRWHTKDYFSSWLGPAEAVAPQDESSAALGRASDTASAAAVAPTAGAEAQGAGREREGTPAQQSRSPRPGPQTMSREAPAAKAPGSSAGIAAGFLTRKDKPRGAGTKGVVQGRPGATPPAGAGSGARPTSNAAAGLSSVETAASLNATEEKERGNDLYRRGRYEEAVRCYSHSLALDPTAVVFANRAMAFLKLGRYEEAERDCNEALDRDDEYVKALSRRATARLRLKRPMEALQDIAAALALEPGSKDLVSLKEQAEKTICSAPNATSVQPSAAKQAEGKLSDRPGQVVEDLAPSAPRAHEPEARVPPESTAGPGEAAPAAREAASEAQCWGREAAPAAPAPQVAQPHVPVAGDNVAGAADSEQRRGDQPLVPKGEASGSRVMPGVASTRAAAAPESPLVAKSMRVLWQQRLASGLPGSGLKPPESSYEFEAAWRALSSMHGEQGAGLEYAHRGLQPNPATTPESGAKLAYLKTLDASRLPALLKDSLSGPLLLDILCTVLVPSFLLKGDDFRTWALSFLDNLQRTPRFGIASLCLTAPMRAGIAYQTVLE